MKKFQLILGVVLVCTSIVYPQKVFEFLRLDNSPRAAALAGSYVSNDDDPNVMFYNPAGISLLENTPVSFSYTKHLLDINSANLVVSKYIEGIGRFGAGIQYINYGSFTRSDEFGNKIGDFGAGDFAFTVGYGNRLDENFYYGANLKFIYSGIADVSSTGLAFDLGLHYAIPDQEWNFGFSILNLGTQLSTYFNTKEDLPLDIRLGVSKRLQNTPLKFYLTFNKLNEKQDDFFDRFKQITFGTEFFLGESLRLRLGYDSEKRKEFKIGTTTGLAGFSFGVGFKISDYNFDYAFTSMGSIGSLHRIGIMTDVNF